MPCQLLAAGFYVPTNRLAKPSPFLLTPHLLQLALGSLTYCNRLS